MPVPAIPSATLDVDNTVFASLGVLRFIPKGKTEADAIDFLCDLIDYDGTSEVSELKFPGEDGITRPLRRDLTEVGETLTLKCYDLEKVKEVLGGLNGFADGTAEAWIRDPKDAEGMVRVYAAPFPCTVQRDGQIKFGEKTYGSANLKFTNTDTKSIDFTFNAALTPAP